MMREIKFRGKMDYDYYREERWISGYYCEKNSESYIINSWGQEILVDWETVGQWTGLKDKNGVEIYEGDVVEAFYFKDYYSGLVKYDDELAGFYIWFPEQKVTLPVYASHETQKVIGNLFDDHELKERFWDVWNQENNEIRNK